jgi:hypothetical protein
LTERGVSLTSTVRRFSSVAVPYSLLILGIVALLAALVALLSPSLPSVTGDKPIKVTGAQFDPPPYGTSETPPTEVLGAGGVADPVRGEVLAATGADNLVPWAAFAAALLTVGASVLVIEKRRRSTRTNPST